MDRWTLGTRGTGLRSVPGHPYGEFELFRQDANMRLLGSTHMISGNVVDVDTVVCQAAPSEIPVELVHHGSLLNTKYAQTTSERRWFVIDCGVDVSRLQH